MEKLNTPYFGSDFRHFLSSEVEDFDLIVDKINELVEAMNNASSAVEAGEKDV